MKVFFYILSCILFMVASIQGQNHVNMVLPHLLGGFLCLFMAGGLWDFLKKEILSHDTYMERWTVALFLIGVGLFLFSLSFVFRINLRTADMLIYMASISFLFCVGIANIEGARDRREERRKILANMIICMKRR